MQSIKQPRYRAACDQCSGNKVKCTQNKPTCQRCQNLGLPCHYSKSMRAGKPSRSKTKPRAGSSVSGSMDKSNEQQPWSTLDSHKFDIATFGNPSLSLDSLRSFDLESVDLSSLFTDPAQCDQNGSGGSSLAFDESPGSSGQLSTSYPNFNCDMQETFAMDFEQARAAVNSNSSNEQLQLQLPPGQPRASVDPPPAQTPAHDACPEDCNKLATETVHSLYRFPSQAQAGSESCPDIDQVLQSNRVLVEDDPP